MTDLASIAPTTTTEWVLVGFGAIVFVGLWCLFAWQVVRLVRWRRFTRDVESFLIYDYHDRLDGHARDGRPGDERTRVSLVLRDRVKLMGSDMLPRKIFAILGARIRRTVRPTPVWVVVVIALVVVATAVADKTLPLASSATSWNRNMSARSTR